jgi:NAD(P)-dependent dehydrogenase (short-subunit alcohol dehydrogenase family)
MDKVAVITGAARGIGLATARKFIAEDWRVVMIDIDGANQIAAREGLIRESNEASGKTLAIECDVSDPAQVADAIKKALDEFGRIDALVNNAGIAVFKPVTETTYEEWSRVLAVNLSGPFICSQACVPAMTDAGGGSIVNITSISGTRASTLRVAYGTSKAALMHLTKQQAAELGNLGIRVNAVSPGPVDTAMAKEVHTAEIRADYHDSIPLNRYGTEEELAEAIFFLSSDKASYINGHTLNVDGGFAATGIGLTSLRNDD